jgi:hypothetical protein
MIMKKLVAIAVVFALAAGGVFAADLSASVFGNVDLFAGNTIEKADGFAKVLGDGGMGRLRLEGSGENDDGTFGAWIRFEPNHWFGNPQGLAWWKPADMFKLAIGGNPDGLYGKEGYAGWMFHQIANDSGVVVDDQAWGAAYAVAGENFRQAFYGGFGNNALFLEIKPVDMFALNIILPYLVRGDYGLEWSDDEMDFVSVNTTMGNHAADGVAYVFKNMVIQADINLDFGNIALTFDMFQRTWQDGPDVKVGGKVFLFFGLNAIENLDLALGVGFGLPQDSGDTMDPISIGLAAKYAINDAFGIKARTMASLGGKAYGTSIGGFGLILDVLPYYAISDSVTVSADIGINMYSPKSGDSMLTFHFNPYVQVGNEWGPAFFAGVKMYSGKKGAGGDPDKSPIYFSVPIGLEVSF